MALGLCSRRGCAVQTYACLFLLTLCATVPAAPTVAPAVEGPSFAPGRLWAAIALRDVRRSRCSISLDSLRPLGL